ncbi:MAG: (Fe-S)-binding protein [Candidatus Bathyarchaeota archaeon]|nr:MAG: (Fe-S)-binding protein [Candidatus Bathyarchaeota archaeon]
MEASAQDFIGEYKLLECIQCGVCTGGCPVSMKSGLNIRMMMREIKFSGKVEIPPEDTLWSCTTCSTCEARCPKELTPFDVIIGMRGITVEEGRIAPTIRDALESVFKHGNPWDRARAKRSEWAEGLDVPSFTGEEDFLYYVGCTPAYDPRGQEVARALVKTFDAADVSFGTLGNDESCCGDSVYSMGEKGLFELLVEDNLEIFENSKISQMVTTSPHCFNAFKNRYGKTSFEPRHYTEYIVELLDSEKLNLGKKVDKAVTFQDPCFLGKQNSIYDEPRKVLESIPGVNFIELDRSRERSLCCEGGGGRMWIDVPGERLAEKRVRDAVELGAEVIATACPFCTSTLEDAILTSGLEGSIQILDIIELVSQAL